MFGQHIVYSVSSWLPITMNWIYTQIKYLEGFAPLILADNVENLDQLPEYPVYSIKNKGTRFLFTNMRRVGVRLTPPAYQSALRKYQPTVLHSHFGDRAWFDLPMAKKHTLKQIVTFYGYDLSQLPKSRPVWKERYLELFEYADRFLCEGPHMAQMLVKIGCSPEKVSVHRLGVDLDQTPFIQRAPVDHGEIKILIAGRFIEKKGIPYALEAIGILKDKFPNLRVTVIGDSSGTRWEVKEKSKILEIIRSYHLESMVKLSGFQALDVLMSELYNHHIFLSPSVTATNGDTEGGAPVTIIQALASGMPVVSTTHCDIPGVVTHGVSGLLTEEHDVNGLVLHLQALIEDPGQWAPMAEAGRKHIEAEFNARLQGERLLGIYEEL